jgi:hypothetical protein
MTTCAEDGNCLAMASPVISSIYCRLFRTIKNKMISMRQGFKVRQLLNGSSSNNIKMIVDYSESYIKEILKEVKTIAVVGASANQDRDSYKVMQALIQHGYQIFPINPNEEGNPILGQLCYSDLSSVSGKIDMVDVFRAADAVMGVTKEAIKIGAKVLWTQLGIVNEEASELAKKAGLKVIMDRCPKIELAKTILD